MKLLTLDARKSLPALYSTEHTPEDQKVAVVKFFQPWGSWTWYALEFDGVDTFFGLVDGFEKELGYFSLTELTNLTGPMGLKIERDMSFEPTLLKTLL